MLTLETVLLIIGTAVSVAGAMGAAGLFVLRLVIARDVSPLGEKLTELRITLSNAVTTIDQHANRAKEGEAELHAILEDLRRIVGDHETRITVLEAHHA